MTDYYTLRGGTYYYVRRRPKDLQEFEKRALIRISLKTDDEAEARKRAEIQNAAVERHWREIVKNPGITEAAQETAYKAAVARARAQGFAYRTINDLIDTSVAEITNRALALAGSETDRKAAAALLGGEKPPALGMKKALDIYFRLTETRIASRTDHEKRKWRNPRILAVNNFMAAVGNKDITLITRADLLQFREYWQTRIIADGRSVNSANKDMMFIKDIIATVALSRNLDIDTDAMFLRLRLRGEKGQRRPFDAEYIQNTLLAAGTLDGLNADARALVWIMADTGARVSEITGLEKEDIFLDAEIPHIWIRSNTTRGLKTQASERKIPLVGTALAALKAHPAGLTRYGSDDNASNAVNKFLAENNLRPSKRHSLYSLRHSFKDRLRDAGAPEEVINGLMGHAARGPVYGRGHTLETKHKWLQKIAFTAPDLQ